MRIRPFERSDFDALIALARKMWSESTYRNLNLDDGKLRKLGERMVTDPDMFGFLAEEESGERIGFFIGFIAEHYFGTDKVASDLALFVDPGRRGGMAAIRLMNAFEQWAVSKGAKEICLGITTGVNEEITQKLYARLGYERSGIICKKRPVFLTQE